MSRTFDGTGYRPGRRWLRSLDWTALGVLCALIVVVSEGVIEIGGPYRPLFYLGLFLALVLAAVRIVLVAWETARTEAEPVVLPTRRLSTRPLDHLVSLLNVSRAVSNEASVVELNQVIVDSCRDCFECDEVSLMMLDADRQQLSVTAFAGHREKHLIRNARVRVGESVAGMVAETRTPIILGSDIDPKRFSNFEVKQRRINSAMVAPIIVKNRVVGVINASSSDPGVAYTEDDLRVLCILAEHAGIAAAKALDSERMIRLIRRLRHRSREAAA